MGTEKSMKNDVVGYSSISLLYSIMEIGNTKVSNFVYY